MKEFCTRLKVAQDVIPVVGGDFEEVTADLSKSMAVNAKEDTTRALKFWVWDGKKATVNGEASDLKVADIVKLIEDTSGVNPADTDLHCFAFKSGLAEYADVILKALEFNEDDKCIARKSFLCFGDVPEGMKKFASLEEMKGILKMDGYETFVAPESIEFLKSGKEVLEWKK